MPENKTFNDTYEGAIAIHSSTNEAVGTRNMLTNSGLRYTFIGKGVTDGLL